jgi:hypothetical protein
MRSRASIHRVMDPSAPLGYPGAQSQPPQQQSRGSSAHAGPRYGPSPGYASPPPGYRPPPAGGPPPAFTPPQERSRQRRRSPASDPGGLVAGLVIAGIGLFFLAGQLEPDIGRFVTMFIGLALLAVFVVTRQYGFLVPGSILTGVGIGIVLDSAASGVAESGVMMLALAGGFLGIWVIGSLYRLSENHWWPLIPGGILTLIGLVQLTRTDVAGALRLWPVILIVLGAFVLAKAITRRD